MSLEGGVAAGVGDGDGVWADTSGPIAKTNKKQIDRACADFMQKILVQLNEDRKRMQKPVQSLFDANILR